MESQASLWNPVGTEAAHSYSEQTVSISAIKSNSTESPSLSFIPKSISKYLWIMHSHIDEDDTIRFA